MDNVQHINPPLIQRVMDTHRMPNANNPMSKRVMQTRVRTHKRTTRGNTPGVLPMIMHPNIIEHINDTEVPLPKRIRIPRNTHAKQAKDASAITPRRSTRLRGTEPSTHVQFRNSRMISQEAINLLLMDNINNDVEKLTPLKLQPQSLHQQNALCDAHGPPHHG